MVDMPNKSQQLPKPDPEPPSKVLPPVKHQASFGERMFDLSVYGGIGYLVNGAVSLVVTRYAKQKENNLVNSFSKYTYRGFEKFWNVFLQSPKRVKNFAEFSDNILFLGSGGWLLLLPMKWMEDRKAQMVRFMDRTLGTGPKTEEEIQAQQEAISSAPQQDYFSLFTGRLGSYLATIFVALPFITKTTSINEKLSNFYLKHFSKHMNGLSKPVLPDNPHMPKFVDSLSKETILAGTAAGLHFVSSKGIANVRHNIKEPHVTADTITPSPVLSKVAHADRLENEPEQQISTGT